MLLLLTHAAYCFDEFFVIHRGSLTIELSAS